MSFADNLKTLLSHKGIRQAHLTDKLDITRTRISNYLSGRSEPDYTTLVRIADILDVTVDSLLDYKAPAEDVPLLFDYGFPELLKECPKNEESKYIPVYSSYGRLSGEIHKQGYLKQNYTSQLFGYYALVVADNSLEPDIKAGDMVYVKPCTRQDIISVMQQQQDRKVICAFNCHENDHVGTMLLKCRFKDSLTVCYNNKHLEIYDSNMPLKGIITGIWRAYG